MKDKLINNMDPDDIINDFENLKISAFKKNFQINNVRKVINCHTTSKFSSDTSNGPNVKTKKLTHPRITFEPENVVPIRHAIKEFDIQRQQQLTGVINARINKFVEFSKNQAVKTKTEWLNTQQAFIDDLAKKENHILQEMELYDKRTSSEHAKLVQHYEQIAARRKQQEEELQAKEKQRQLLNMNIEKIRAAQLNYSAEYQQLVNVLKNVTLNEGLKKAIEEKLTTIKKLTIIFDEIIRKCGTGDITDEDVKKAYAVVNTLKSIKVMVEESVKKYEEETKKQQSIPEVQIKQQPEQVFNQQTDATDNKLTINEGVKITTFISVSNLKFYTEIMEFLDNHSKSFTDLLNDNSMKQFKFECKKAINIPVNTISAVNSEHLLDKYMKLHNLLSGKTITVADKKINASHHPQGISFCINLLAQKFVLQGDLMISSNPESAFCYATIINSLWNDFPVFGKLLLAYFYKYCPYLVPYYIPRSVDETDETFYTRQGYQYINGQVEEQDKFLKRMTGIARLYSAILITKPKKSQTIVPHGLKYGWQWLVSMLKLEPRLDITATMLHTFLDSAGFEMDNKYGPMFQKLLRIIFEKFLPVCKQKSTGGAGTRLELLFTDYFKARRFEQPLGYTPYPYW